MYGGSAEADTVAGIVTIQNTAKPSAAPSDDDNREIAQREHVASSRSRTPPSFRTLRRESEFEPDGATAPAGIFEAGRCARAPQHDGSLMKNKGRDVRADARPR